jgi:predicted membrane protein
MFIGVMTNGIFAMIFLAAFQTRKVWAWADHVLFWGMNIGLVGFVVGLITQEAVLKRIFSPIMGVSILLGIAAYSLRLYYLTREVSARTAIK